MGLVEQVLRCTGYYGEATLPQVSASASANSDLPNEPALSSGSSAISFYHISCFGPSMLWHEPGG